MLILCEGPRCNGGLSARDRERALVATQHTTCADLRAEAEKQARGAVSRQLRLTRHTELEHTRGGCVVYCCDACGHERVYGNTYTMYSGFVPTSLQPVGIATDATEA